MENGQLAGGILQTSLVDVTFFSKLNISLEFWNLSDFSMKKKKNRWKEYCDLLHLFMWGHVRNNEIFSITYKKLVYFYIPNNVLCFKMNFIIENLKNIIYLTLVLFVKLLKETSICIWFTV